MSVRVLMSSSIVESCLCTPSATHASCGTQQCCCHERTDGQYAVSLHGSRVGWYTVQVGFRMLQGNAPRTEFLNLAAHERTAVVVPQKNSETDTLCSKASIKLNAELTKDFQNDTLSMQAAIGESADLSVVLSSMTWQQQLAHLGARAWLVPLRNTVERPVNETFVLKQTGQYSLELRYQLAGLHHRCLVSQLDVVCRSGFELACTCLRAHACAHMLARTCLRAHACAHMLACTCLHAHACACACMLRGSIRAQLRRCERRQVHPWYACISVVYGNYGQHARTAMDAHSPEHSHGRTHVCTHLRAHMHARTHTRSHARSHAPTHSRKVIAVEDNVLQLVAGGVIGALFVVGLLSLVAYARRDLERFKKLIVSFLLNEE